MQQRSSTPEQERVAILLRAADRAIETAELIVQHTPHQYESAGFSCQQAVENYTKAVLTASSLPAPFMHVLAELLQPLGQAAIVFVGPYELSAATILQDFAVERRPGTDDAPSYTSADLLAMAHHFRDNLRPVAQAFLI
ncbi:HEPN domain-containing protein [Hymenobacter sp. HMF4947]|uniref:HEPN domain-containing protein n=1 Tax=Hymenobacter ginkgonis TaxID=2682976 RepID=A0A7K1TCG1_9BACT|nr:HEPN domain-containing protein [Hymenobacter ginkgonis]MVN76096.1 HEPN domain-containing protein [Hymenobacter ginkgonis]